MKKSLFLCFIVFSSYVFSQTDYYVTAPSGLIVRDKPNGKRIGKIPYGSSVKVENKLAPYSVVDNGKNIEGNWVEIAGNNFQVLVDDDLTFPIDTNKYYAFDGFLTSKEEFIHQNERIIAKYPALKDYYLATSFDVFAIKGDFFGDTIEDDLFRMIDSKGNVRIMILNHQKNGSQIYGLGGTKDPFEIEDYSLPILYKVSKGTPLWSNYEEDFRAFKDVPKNEIVKLNYDAFYIHESEACGGGFIFWKNNKWNWLQQE